MSKFEGCIKRLSSRHEPVRETHHQSFLPRDAATRENHIKRVTMADKPRQTHGSTINQWNAPATTIYPKDSILSSDTQITPQGDFKPTRDSVSLDSSNNRLRQKQARNP